MEEIVPSEDPFLSHRYIYISIDRPDTKTQNLNFLTTDYKRR